MHYGQSASDRASHAEEATRPCKYRAKEKKRRGCQLNIFKDCPRVANDFIPPPLSPGGCVKTTKQTRRHFDRREKSPSTTFPKAAVRFLPALEMTRMT